MSAYTKAWRASELRRWTDQEADKVVIFLEENSPDLLAQIGQLERTTQDLRGGVGDKLVAAILKVYPNVANRDRPGLTGAVRRRIRLRLG